MSQYRETIDYRWHRHTNHALSHLYHDIQCRLAHYHYGVISAKDWVFVNSGTRSDIWDIRKVLPLNQVSVISVLY